MEAGEQSVTRIMTPLRVLLRDETRDAHEALHQLPVFRRLARSTIGRAEYAALLQRMESFYASFDAALAAACERHACAIGDVVHARRAPLILRDMTKMGVAPARGATPDLPALDEPGAIAGALYVVDGALLGGAVLGSAVRRLGWPAPGGFWSWCRTEGPGLWRRTQSLLDRVAPADEKVVLAAAVGTFGTFAGWVGQLAPEPVG